MPVIAALLVPLHLGSLHAWETALLALLAFGPFAVLAVVVVVLRRRDAADDEATEAPGPASRWETGRGRL
jgi:hypothetical protein